MRLPKEKSIPNLSVKTKEILTYFSKSRTEPLFLVNRSKIILLSAEGLTNGYIASCLGIHHNTVSLWKRRFIESADLLDFVESELPQDLKDLITVILSNRHRSGAPKTYDDETRCKIKLIACQNPEDHGFTLNHWNLPCIRLALIRNEVVDDISIGAVYHILITDEIRLWKIRYWLHSKKNMKITTHTHQRYRP